MATDTTIHTPLQQRASTALHTMPKRPSLIRSSTQAALLGLCLLSAGCSPEQATATEPAPQPADSAIDINSPNAPFKAHGLTIYGYNYTDTSIGSFEVNGRGGGNLGVSNGAAGGGSSVCCFSVYSPLRKPQKIKIKWTREGDIWCEQEVWLAPKLPPKPEYMEVHFYRDGHIEVAVTEEASPARLNLPAASSGHRFSEAAKKVNNDDKFGTCQRGY